MRAIAAEAGVSLGSAYYYFDSKEHLIQAFYEHTHTYHAAACRRILAEQRRLRDRLLGVLRNKLGTVMPYHQFAAQLFQTAADPASPLSPFSDDSNLVRRQETELLREVVDGSSARIPIQLRPLLPELLWLYEMGIVLFWIHDRSAGCDRTYRLLERSVDVVVCLLQIAGLPLFTPVLSSALHLADDLGLLPGVRFSARGEGCDEGSS